MINEFVFAANTVRANIALLPLLVIILFVIWLATKAGGRKLLTVLGVGALLLLAWAMLPTPRMATDQEMRSHVDVAVPMTQDGQQLISGQKHRPAAQSKFAQASTEEMWEHLNRSRIVLDGNQQETSKPVAKEFTKGKFDEKIELDDEESLTEKESQKLDRPDWVDVPPKRVGNLYRVAISAGPYKTIPECHRALESELRQVFRHRLEQLNLGHSQPSLETLGLGLDFVLREICRMEWTETTEPSFGKMKTVHVLMEFDNAVDDQIRIAYRNYHRSFRIAQVGGIAGLVVGTLALIYGLLQLDTWTRGYYTKRLFLAVPAVIIVLVLLTIA